MRWAPAAALPAAVPCLWAAAWGPPVWCRCSIPGRCPARHTHPTTLLLPRLSQVRALLAKLQAVFDLPRKLRAAIDRGAFEVAADCYADAAPLLKKYGHKVRAAPRSFTVLLRCCSAVAGQRQHPPCMPTAAAAACLPCAQGAFKRVAADVEVLGHELAALLRKRLLAAPDQARWWREPAVVGHALVVGSRGQRDARCGCCAARRLTTTGVACLPTRFLVSCRRRTASP